MLNTEKNNSFERKDFNKKEIDDVINKIILKNRSKLEHIHQKNDDVSLFSPVTKENDSIYYVKEKKKKKEAYSGEIINDAREKLGKKPLKEKFKENENLKNDAPRKKEPAKKMRIVFGRKKPSDFDFKEKSPDKDKIYKTEDIKSDKDFNKVVSKIEEELDRFDSKDNSRNHPKEIEEKNSHIDRESIINTDKQKIDDKGPINDSIKKEHEKSLKTKGLKDIFKKKENGKTIDIKRKIDFSDYDNTKQNFNKKTENKPEVNEKMDFDRNKTEGKSKNDVSEDKNNPSEEFIPPVPQVNKPKFKIENVPKSEDQEKNLIDEKIKDFKTNSNNKDNVNPEKRALNLANNHIKKQDKKPNLNSKFDEKQNDSPALNIEKDNSHEHVFFDEDSTSGWTPHSTEDDKNQSNVFLENVKGETDVDQFGEVGDVELPKEALDVDSVKLSELGFSEKDWEELDFYSLQDPFSYVEILREKETLEKRYFLVEAELTDEEKKVMDFIHETIFSMDIETESLEKMGEKEYLASQIDKVIKEYSLDIEKSSFDKILYYLSKKSLGFDKLDPLLNDPNIEDISCDGANVPIFLYHRKYGSLKSNVKFDSEEKLSSFIYKLAQKCGKHISIADPMLDATMPDGSRIQMTLSDEITAHGSTFTIRKFRSDPFSPPDLVEFNTMSSEMLAYMWLAVENGISMLFSGGTASGKTSTLNALSLFIPPESKIVSIEETREINLPHPNWIPGVARSGFGEIVADKMVGEIDLYDLMKAALRQRPEYILVGEIRGKEAYVLFQAMATGHATYSTVHADSAQSLIHRLEGKPINIPRVMLQSLDVVSLHITTKVNNKRVRRCKQIIEIIDIDPSTKEILTNEAFRWDPVEDKFFYSGKSYVLERIRAEKDLSRDQITTELRQRQRIIDHMNENNIRGFRQVAHTVSRYIDNPKEVLDSIEKGSK